MLDFDALKTSLYNAVIAILPTTPVIYYYQNAPRPTEDYVTLHILSVTHVGWDYKGQTDSLGTIQQKGDRQIALSVQAYGNNAFSLLYEIKNSLQKETIIDLLAIDGISYYNATDITDLTSLVNSRFESRANMDLFFRLADSYSDDVGLIESIEIDETLDTINDVQIIPLI